MSSKKASAAPVGSKKASAAPVGSKKASAAPVGSKKASAAPVGSKKASAASVGSKKASAASAGVPSRKGDSRAREVSAGGVVLHEGQVLVIVPSRRAADGSLVLALPKGHLDEGETAPQAATREVREETGVTAELLGELGEVRYWYVRNRKRVSKSVYFFLFSYLSGDVEDHDDEVLEARWIDLAEAREALTYPGERDMVDRALAIDPQDR